MHRLKFILCMLPADTTGDYKYNISIKSRAAYMYCVKRVGRYRSILLILACHMCCRIMRSILVMDVDLC